MKEIVFQWFDFQSSLLLVVFAMVRDKDVLQFETLRPTTILEEIATGSFCVRKCFMCPGC